VVSITFSKVFFLILFIISSLFLPHPVYVSLWRVKLRPFFHLYFVLAQYAIECVALGLCVRVFWCSSLYPAFLSDFCRIHRFLQSIRLNEESISEWDATPSVHTFSNFLLTILEVTFGRDLTTFPLERGYRHYSGHCDLHL
jgi:hypothetical protein